MEKVCGERCFQGGFLGNGNQNAERNMRTVQTLEVVAMVLVNFGKIDGATDRLCRNSSSGAINEEEKALYCDMTPKSGPNRKF